MLRVLAVAIAVTTWLVLPAAALAQDGGEPSPGAPGIGDPYFPLDGNGGYDVRRYRLDVGYEPATDVLTGVATIRARATQGLSSFNLDLVGLNVRSVSVDDRTATWTRDGGELTVTPAEPVRDGRRMRVVVRYDGVPQTLGDENVGRKGFFHTDDGTLIAGEPDSAATWFPVNDHPLDKAAYTFRITVPEGLEAIANGVLRRSRTRNGETTWVWRADEPMAPYLATATIGQFDLRAYEAGGLRYWDALDPDLFAPTPARTGEQRAWSQIAESSYKRLTRTIDVPAGGAQLSFWVTRDMEPGWDFLFVEARTPGGDDWTTLRDANGHTGRGTASACPSWLTLHPFLRHYQTPVAGGSCSPTGTSGAWWAATGASDGYERWTVDLAPYAGRAVEVSLSYASDNVTQHGGVFVDDIEVSAGAGSTSFEADDDPLDGWTASAAPAGSAPNANTWIAGTAETGPLSTGELAEAALARQSDIIAYLSEVFGPYPFTAAGGIVDDLAGMGFALENQTRPIYAREFFTDQTGPNDSVVAHELAHQWFGDSLAVGAWQHIWLNEGFANYAEWLWSEHERRITAQRFFDFYYGAIPAGHAFWTLKIGEPGPGALFAQPIYLRGAMTLHALRRTIGDTAFFTLIRQWATANAGGNVTTDQFIALAEEVSGRELDAFFDRWLFTAGKPAISAAAARRARARVGAANAARDARMAGGARGGDTAVAATRSAARPARAAARPGGRA